MRSLTLGTGWRRTTSSCGCATWSSSQWLRSAICGKQNAGYSVRILRTVLYHHISLPLSTRYHSAVRGHWSKYFWALLCSAFQQLGTFFYWGSEWSDGFIHQPALVRHSTQLLSHCSCCTNCCLILSLGLAPAIRHVPETEIFLVCLRIPKQHLGGHPILRVLSYIQAPWGS